MTIRVRALGEEGSAELARMARSRTLGVGLVPLHRDYDTLAGSG